MASVRQGGEIVYSTADWNALRESGNAAFKEGRFDDAVRAYSSAIMAEPTQAPLFANRAMALLKLGRFSDAEADCSRALAIAPDTVKVLWRRGSARMQLKRYDDAVQDLKRALQLEPGNKDVAKDLAAALQAVKAAAAPTESGAATTTANGASATATPPSSNASATAGTPPATKAPAAPSNPPAAKTTAAPATKAPAAPSNPPAAKTTTASATPSTATPSAAAPSAATSTPSTTSASLPSPDAATKRILVQVIPAASPSKPLEPTPVIAQLPPPTDVPPAPANAVDFEKHWRSITLNRELLYAYIKSLPLALFGKVAKEALNSERLGQLIELAKDFYLSRDSLAVTLDLLEQLPLTFRFDLNLMLMSSAHTQALKALFAALDAAATDDESRAKVAVLRSKFKL